MLRRFLLVGLMVVVVEQGTAMQVLVGTLLAAIFLLFQVFASPYKVCTPREIFCAITPPKGSCDERSV